MPGYGLVLPGGTAGTGQRPTGGGVVEMKARSPQELGLTPVAGGPAERVPPRPGQDYNLFVDKGGNYTWRNDVPWSVATGGGGGASEENLKPGDVLPTGEIYSGPPSRPSGGGGTKAKVDERQGISITEGGGTGALPKDYQRNSDKLYADIKAAQQAELEATGKKSTDQYWSSMLQGAQAEGISLAQMVEKSEGNKPDYKVPESKWLKEPARVKFEKKETLVKEKDYVELENWKGEGVRVKTDDAASLSSSSGKTQFERMMDLGLIPQDSTYIPIAPDDKDFITGQREWYYRTPDQQKQYVDLERNNIELADGQYISKADYDKLDPKYRQIGAREGADAMVKAIEADHEADFKAGKVELPGGSFIAKNDWESLDEKYRAIGLDKGYDAMAAAIDADIKENNETAAALKPYINTKDNTIDLDRAILDGVPRKQLETVLDKKVINEAEERLSPTMEAEKEAVPILKRTGWLAKWRGTSIQDWKDLLTLTKDASKAAPYALGVAASDIEKQTQDALVKIGKLPDKMQIPAKVAAGLAIGAMIKAPLGMASLTVSLAGIPVAKDKVQYTKQIGLSIADYFTKEILRQFAADPVYAVSENVGTFVLGPEGVVKLARSGITRASPWYIPSTGMKYTFTTGKIATRVGDVAEALKKGKITEVGIANAIARVQDRALKSSDAIAMAKIGKSDIYVKIEPTPVSKNLGGMLWRASPTKEAYAGAEHVVNVAGNEPAEFYSLQAAPRFALTSASGTPATTPSLVMLYTKKAGIQYFPNTVSHAKSLAEMESKGFQYLGSGKAKPGAYPPIKTYLSRFEDEAMLPNGMKIYRVKNLHSRIFGEGSGEFVTTVDGWVMPIYRFAEKGAKVPEANIAKLAAIRVESVVHGLKALAGKKGFSTETLHSEKLAKEFDAAAKVKTKGKTGKAYEKVVEDQAQARIRRAYDANRATLERAWRANPDKFERAYLERINDRLSREYGMPPRRVEMRRSEPIRVTRDRTFERRMAGYRAERLVEEIRASRQVRREEGIRRPMPRIGTSRLRVEPVRPRVTRLPPIRTIPARGVSSRGIPLRIVRPPRGTPPITRPPRVRVLQASDSKASKVRKPEDYKNATTWSQGLGYWTIFQDGSAEFNRHIPEGATVVERPTPARTIQVIRGRPGGRTREFTADMGIQDIRVVTQSTRPGKPNIIAFRSDRGQRTTSQLRLGRRREPQPRPQFPNLKPRARFRSERYGRIYRTHIGGGYVLSREKLR